MSNVEREKVIKTYCDKAKKEVTVVIGINKEGGTKYVKVLCPYYYYSWLAYGSSCEKGGRCGIAKGAWR